MKQVFLSGKGQIKVIDVPAPNINKDSILVKNNFSLISTGTEASAVVSRTGLPGLYEKVWNSKDKFEQVWNLVQNQGVKSTFDMVQGKLEDYTMIGYSSSGTVQELENDNLPFQVGQNVACMGTGFANHAEYISVPKNLAVPIPMNVSQDEASFASIACIALQGIRRLDLTPGERVGVIGLGLIGQVCVRLLQAMGFDSFGLDLSIERANKANEVKGIDAWSTKEIDSLEKITSLTNGKGLDGVVICAATNSNTPVNLAFDLCRQRGRVSVVGDVGLQLERSKMYKKEIELRMSSSYGPGRYDYNYEIKGNDYPYGFVRWTEQRNLEFFLDLLSQGRLDLKSLISKTFEVEQAFDAYSLLKEGREDIYGAVLKYSDQREYAQETVIINNPLKEDAVKRIKKDKVINLGLIGVGGYAKGVHIPNLNKLKDTFKIYGVASNSGGTAGVVGKKNGALYATSDYNELLNDDNIDAVIITTRHASHAKITLDAIRAKKHVFVEKPLAITVEDCEKIIEKAKQNGVIVRVGFNRRFSPYLREMKNIIGNQGIKIFNCRINIGSISSDWSNTFEEGGRLMGEGVHFFDLCNWFMDQEPISISGNVAGENKITNPNSSVQIKYPDGSIANVLYTSLGSNKMEKEYYEAFGNGKSVIVDNFNKIEAFGAPIKTKLKKGDKGQLEELIEFAKVVKGEDYPLCGANGRDGLLATKIAKEVYS